MDNFRLSKNKAKSPVPGVDYEPIEVGEDGFPLDTSDFIQAPSEPDPELAKDFLSPEELTDEEVERRMNELVPVDAEEMDAIEATLVESGFDLDKPEVKALVEETIRQASEMTLTGYDQASAYEVVECDRASLLDRLLDVADGMVDNLREIPCPLDQGKALSQLHKTVVGLLKARREYLLQPYGSPKLNLTPSTVVNVESKTLNLGQSSRAAVGRIEDFAKKNKG